ncbi:5-oxoprolinase subunit C family protein [Methylobacterium haplocladii]|uniref:Allophanate hydrolase n=1 Tax=Methylobacterium haplocladii TaxID=1176176 RepID=A0A512IRG5_9HYPH|nr:biotin-dependent carboxyltransferase family protein [Methylobacterium haplocladii]GEP00300.1 allophanate hydrolase [Methylobacterium haplocladii]GJD86071.1 5-oxoprolinase subunit C [Methylobacterium haplocladii]GLS59790.1 allophanate hydrolase [Methylobacterium haplocladii]
MSVVLVVLSCGAATTLQDGGRRGYLRYGLSASGPMDCIAHAGANILVGNVADASAIEFGLGGGRFRIEGGAVRLALAGAPCPIRLDGEPVAHHRSLVLREGSELSIDRPREGVFATLALAGGIAVEPVLSSASLHLRAALGGLDGRPLHEGDRLPLAPPPLSGEPECCLDPVPIERDRPIRVVLGPQADRFTEAGIDTLLNAAFTVSNRADRMGYQLDGPEIAHGLGGFNIVSDGTVAGAIQVPGSGRPIVLLADRQTTGGYPKIATVISADLRRLAQRRPGETVRFESIPLREAVRQARERAAAIAELPTRARLVADAPDRLLGANLAGNAVDAFDERD